LCWTIEVRSDGCIGIGPSSVGLDGDGGGPGVQERLGGSAAKTFEGKVMGIGDTVSGEEFSEVLSHSQGRVVKGDVLRRLKEKDIDGVSSESIHTRIS